MVCMVFTTVSMPVPMPVSMVCMVFYSSLCASCVFEMSRPGPRPAPAHIHTLAHSRSPAPQHTPPRAITSGAEQIHKHRFLEYNSMCLHKSPSSASKASVAAMCTSHVAGTPLHGKQNKKPGRIKKKRSALDNLFWRNSHLKNADSLSKDPMRIKFLGRCQPKIGAPPGAEKNGCALAGNL